jgi:hypothetical protein
MMVPLLVTLPPFYAQDVGLSLAAISLAFGVARAAGLARPGIATAR